MSEIGDPIPFPMPRERPLDPPSRLAQCRANSPLRKVTIWDGSEPWLVTRYEDVRTILTDDRFSAEVTRPGFPRFSPGAGPTSIGATTFFNMDPPEHDIYRRMLTGEFAVRRVMRLRDELQNTADELVEELIAAPQPADLIEQFALPFPSLAICHLLGVPYDDHALFQRNSRTIMDAAASQEEVIEAGNQIGQYMRELVISKVEDPGDDLIGRLIVDQVQSGALNLDELVDIARLLLFGGHETTASMIGMAALVILAHPDQQAALRESPDLIGKAIEECLRFVTVNHLGRRRVAKEVVELHGQMIQPGEGIIAAGDSANRDDQVFENPDVFDITREASHHVSFGFGIHQCLGQNLAPSRCRLLSGRSYSGCPTFGWPCRWRSCH